LRVSSEAADAGKLRPSGGGMRLLHSKSYYNHEMNKEIPKLSGGRLLNENFQSIIQ
jgi:hypothetical protein